MANLEPAARDGTAPPRPRAGRLLSAPLWLALGLPLAGAGPLGEPGSAPPEQVAQYHAEVAKTIVELQPFRREQTAVLDPSGTPVRLIALNPHSNSWFLLVLGREGAGDSVSYHLENPDPRAQRVGLSAEPAVALEIGGMKAEERCAPWTGAPTALEAARDSGLPYAPLCGGRLYLRNRVSGSRTGLERVTDFLRDHVWKGEEIVGFVRDTVFRDSFAVSGKRVPADPALRKTGGPDPARIDPAFAGQAVAPATLGLGLSGVSSGRMELGMWYPAADLPDVYVSAIQPEAISAGVLRGPGRTNPLDGVEGAAVGYMVAFDLSRFDLGFALGTDHPRLGWSPRPPASMRNRALPGPDGIDGPAPLVTNGMISPAQAGRTIATLTGGFKRQHGAFKYGEFSTRNAGSHYGFIEQGVIVSKLQPGLSTIIVLDDGSVEMKTWTAADDRRLDRVRFARQNGVPLLETDPAGGPGIPGDLVTRWGAGNWSGSADRKLRTLRAGACLQQSPGGRFLLYGYFSTATPSAMARTFQAYGCRYAMLLDMNALEHTYLALYVRRGGEMHVAHLIQGMSEVDKTGAGGKLIPRFIGFPDNRDFFYLTRREDPP